jgi:hypothetical protein
MNEISATVNEPIAEKPSTRFVVIYFVGLGLFFGAPIALGALAQRNTISVVTLFGAILIYLLCPLLVARGISQYKKWGRIFGLIISWFLIFAVGLALLSFLGRIVGIGTGATPAWSLAAFFTLLLDVGIIVASTLVVRFLSRHRAAFS